LVALNAFATGCAVAVVAAVSVPPVLTPVNASWTGV
jgi:hypothetical protein